MSEEQQAVEPSEPAGLLDDVSASDSSQQDSAAAEKPVEHRAINSIPEDEPVERPEYWPENFWNKDQNEPDLEGIAKSWMDLRKMVSQGKHKAPVDGKYDTTVFGEGPLDSNPLAPTVLDWAKENGISQAAFDSLITKVRDISQQLAPQEPAIDVKAEMKSLGPNAAAIKNGMVSWARGLVNKGYWDGNDFEEFKVMGGTARGLRALMKIRENYEGRIPIETQPVDGAPTDEELRSMVGNINDPNNPYVKDAAYRQKVERMFLARYTQ